MEPFWLVRASDLTDDPIMMEGFLDYYEDRPEVSLLRKNLEETLFNEQGIYPHLSGDLMLLFRLLDTLPQSLFAPYADLLAERASEGTWKRLNPIYRVLSVIDPERTTKLFTRFFEGTSSPEENTLWQISNNLLLLPESQGKSLLDRILSENLSGRVLSALLPAAFRFGHPNTPDILASIMLSDGSSVYFIDSIASTLLDHDAWFKIFSEVRSGRLFPLSDVAGLFEEGAPFAEMERILLLEKPLGEAVALLGKYAHLSDGPLQILKSLQEGWSLLSESLIEPATALVLAAVAHIFERKTLDAENLSLDETISFLSADITWNRHVEALSARLKDFPPDEVLHAMEEAIEGFRGFDGGFFLAQAMGLLAREEFIPLLISCMDDSSGDFLAEKASDALIAIGEPSVKTLVTEWERLDSSQQIYGSSVMLSVGGNGLPEFLLAHTEDLYEESREMWCDMALSVADPKFLPHLRSELKRRNPFVDAAYYRLCRLFGVDDPELPEIRKRIEAEQSRINGILSNGWDGISIPTDQSSLTLSLRCQRCGKSNKYMVDSVFVGDEDDAPLVSGEFPCLSCDQWSEFDLDPEGLLSVNLELMRIMAAMDDGIRIVPRVKALNVDIADGFTESLPKAFRRMKERIRENPSDWHSLHRLSNLLIVLKRPRATFECTARAYELNPDCLEIVINRILSLQEQGMEVEAFDLAQNALENRFRWILVSRDKKTRHEEFEGLYNELIASLDLDLPEIRLVVRSLPPGMEKIGRNDPCPCGSGKKYKKCCL